MNLLSEQRRIGLLVLISLFFFPRNENPNATKKSTLILPVSSSFTDGIVPSVNISGSFEAGSLVDPGAVGGDDNLTRLRKRDPLHLFNPILL